MARLGVNIDHVATIRQARYRGMLESPNAEPDPVEAALAAEAGGATGITAHLRQDRRHIQDRDVFQLKSRIGTKLNLEMGVTQEIFEIALRVEPEDVCLVPENRQEVTTEGGLDAAGKFDAVRSMTEHLKAAGIVVSLFIDPDEEQIAAAGEIGAPVVELHTGAFANADGTARSAELDRLAAAAELAHVQGIRVNARGGINCPHVCLLAAVPHLDELNIGHSIVPRAAFVGMRAATEEMAALVAKLR